eukprot:scaffold22183_cov41-Cyclotella_meneghiniana.AAC.5
MGMRRPYGVTVDALKLLFKAVRDINQHEICLVPCNPHSTLPMIWDLGLIEDEQRKLTGNYIDNIEAYAWNDKNVWTFTVATTIDLHYMIQKNYNRDIMGNGGLQVGLKQLEVILKVIDISTSMKEPVAIISKGSKYDDNNRCMEELISRLSDQGQRDYEKSQFDIEWRKVTDPSDDNIYAMMGVIMCDRDVYDTFANDLILLNNSKDIAIHPHTGRWVLYRGRDDDRQPFTMKAGIKNQIEHRNQQEIITLSGMALFDLENDVPELMGNGEKNITEKTILRLVCQGLGSRDKSGRSPFEMMYRKSKDEYVLVSTRSRHDRSLAYFREGHFKEDMHSWYKGNRKLQQSTMINVHLNIYHPNEVKRVILPIIVGGIYEPPTPQTIENWKSMVPHPIMGASALPMPPRP